MGAQPSTTQRPSTNLRLLLIVAKNIAPFDVWPALEKLAHDLDTVTAGRNDEQAVSRFMRVLQDGLDFGKWPAK